MWRRCPRPLILLTAATAVLVVLYAVYRAADPLPPRRLVIAAGAPGSVYDNFAKRYAAILARDGVLLEVRNSVGAVTGFEMLRDPTSDVQAAFTTFDSTRDDDARHLQSLGGVFDAVIFIFYRTDGLVSRFNQLRGKRLAFGQPETALRSLMSQVLAHANGLDAATTLVDLDYPAAVDALVAGEVDAAAFPSQLDGQLLQRALAAPGVALMRVDQAEAIAKQVSGLKRVVFWRGLASLRQDIPNADIELIASRNRLLVRQDLHPALQYLLLKAMREVHGGEGPFQRLGEFPAEQPQDLVLSPMAQAFYRSGLTFWQRYTVFGSVHCSTGLCSSWCRLWP